MPAMDCEIQMYDPTTFIVRFYNDGVLADSIEAKDIMTDRPTLSYLITKDVIEVIP
jgi:hypothetical protein